MNKIVEWIKQFKSSTQYTSKYQEDINFSISIGEICEVCQEELDLYDGGYTGEPTKCKSCRIIETREMKLNQLLYE
jgi:hypothetical protein